VIYPTLSYLEEAELISGQIQGSKRLYAITDAGRALVEQAVALDGVRMRIEVSKRALRGHDRPAEIHEAVGNLRHALHMHSGRWTPTKSSGYAPCSTIPPRPSPPGRPNEKTP
jgi:DNA-binding PadR family transcriptional regulator